MHKLPLGEDSKHMNIKKKKNSRYEDCPLVIKVKAAHGIQI